MRCDRVLAVTLGVFVAVILAILLYERGPSGNGLLPGCLFHRLTGFDCPGCGMTRATHAALHGRLGEAIRFNPLGVIVLPVVLVISAVQIPAWLRDRPLPIRFKVSQRGVWWIVGVVMGYWVLRNIPFWPFTLLAPP